MSEEPRINELAQRLDVEDRKQIEELQQKKTAISDVVRKVEQSRPRYQKRIAECERRLSDDLLEHLLSESNEHHEEIMEELHRYEDRLRGTMRISEAAEEHLHKLRRVIVAAEKRLRSRGRYCELQEKINGLVAEGELVGAQYHAKDLPELARLCGMENDADKLLKSLNLEGEEA